MSFSWAEIWQHMGVPALVIAGILVVMGLASLTVFIERIITLRSSRTQSKAFAAQIGERLRSGDFQAVIDDAEKYEKSHFAKVVRSGLQTYLHARATSDISGLTPAERTRRHLERYLEETGEDLRRGLPVLASVGSVAPFVGLLGTVVGIITAFQGIASTGSGGLSAVSAGISEALVETALGLAVAIPAVLAFNYLQSGIVRDEGMLTRSAGELIDVIEDWEGRALQRRQGKVA